MLMKVQLLREKAKKVFVSGNTARRLLSPVMPRFQGETTSAVFLLLFTKKKKMLFEHPLFTIFKELVHLFSNNKLSGQHTLIIGL